MKMREGGLYLARCGVVMRCWRCVGDRFSLKAIHKFSVPFQRCRYGYDSNDISDPGRSFGYSNKGLFLGAEEYPGSPLHIVKEIRP